MRTIKANLHMHSLYSDGYQWPSEMVIRSKKYGLDLIALTDHDSMEGVEEYLECCRAMNIKGIAACEVDAIAPEIDFDMEILAYFPQGNYSNMKDFLRERLIQRKTIIKELIEKGKELFKNNELSFEDFNQFKLGFMNKNTENLLFSYVKYNLFQYFKLKGALDPEIDYKPFKKTYYTEEKLGVLKEVKPHLLDLVKLINENNGYAVLPHPAWAVPGFDWTAEFVRKNIDKLDNLYSYCHDNGVWGIEHNYYRDETDEINEELTVLAKRYDLNITCGSDCHGRGSDFCTLEKYYGEFSSFEEK